jgi:hypothetical protein
MIDIYWILGKKVDMATDSHNTPLTTAFLNSKLPRFKKGDRVALLYYNGDPTYTVPIRGNSVKLLLQSIYEGVHAPLNQNDREVCRVIYAKIATFIKSDLRKRFVQRFESGKLTIYHLIHNNYQFCEGNFRREKGIWTFAVGS